MKQFIVAILALAVCDTAVAQPSFGFTEDDYGVQESTGVLQVVVTRSGSQEGVIIINVKTLTKQESLDMGVTNPAEPGDDFEMIDVSLTFNDSVDRLTADIDIIDDNIDEEDEERFTIMMDVVEASVDPSVMIARQLTTGLIQDNDNLIMTFELPLLTVSEVQGSLEVYVAKQDGIQSERTVDVAIVIEDITTNLNGLDFTSAAGNSQILTFSPLDTRLPIEITITDDSVVEELEQFSVDLTINPDIVDAPQIYTFGRYESVLISIKDDDEIPTTCPPTNSPTSNPATDCPDPDNKFVIGITLLITFILTFLFTCLLAAICCGLCIGCRDRKKRTKAIPIGQLEQQQQQTQH